MARHAICGGLRCVEMKLDSDPQLSRALTGGQLILVATGSWTASHTRTIEDATDAAERQLTASPHEVRVDLAGVTKLDTFGAWLLERLARNVQDRGANAQLIGYPEHYRGLLEEVRLANRKIEAAEPPDSRVRVMFESVGRKVEQSVADLTSVLAMLGELGFAVGRVLLRPQTFRLTSAVHQLDRVGWRAVPIILLITFLIGCIIAQQGIFHFRKFGAEDYVVDLVGILILREFGVLLVAIMVAGRSGSSYTAELGSMKMREEIDALRTMGLDPVDVLILPRVLALVCALPILTFLGSMAALYGGGLVSWLYGGMSPAIYIARLQEAISVTHFQVGMIKAPFMALVIGAVACSEGLKVKGSAESLGLRTTTSVVKSIFLVVVLDGFFAIFFASIGM